jgi:uncharacterized repeat protein (TIGR01451 family)
MVRLVKKNGIQGFSALGVVITLVLGLGLSSVQAQTCAAPGKEGPCALTGIVNTYHAGAASVAAGANIVTVASVTGQRTNTRTLQLGDQVVVMQMQDSTTPANAGLHEYANIVGIAGAAITLNRPLTNAYNQTVGTTNVRTFQVIYVPQCSSATVAAGSTVSADRWTINVANGQGTGGVVALDVAGSLAVNGTITVAGAGFRGGAGLNGATSRASGTFTDADYAFDPAAINGALKGEGTVGTPRLVFDGTAAPLSYFGLLGQGYAAGAAGRGAQGNAAGGGNDGLPTDGNQYNSGGGGGGNGGAGGQGGSNWNGNGAIATVDSGGRGGNAIANTSARLVMGGGGGAGGSNNNAVANAITVWPPIVSATTRPLPTAIGTVNGATGGISVSGASGGGVVLIRAGTLAGSTGNINADGYTAYNTSGGSEGAGGAGAGGSIFFSAAAGTGSGLTLSAAGGGGGYSNYFSHGPGGGGGGGYIATSLSGATINLAGGLNGYDGCCGGVAGSGSPKAYSGAPGTASLLATAGVPTGNSAGSQCLPVLSVRKTTSTPVVTLPGGTTAQYSINISNAATAGAAYGVAVQDILPSPFGLQTVAQLGSTTLSGILTSGPSPTTPNQSGNTTSAVFGVAGSANTPTVPFFTLFPGGSVTVSFVVNVNTTTLATYQNNASTTFTDPTRATGGLATGAAVTNPVVSPGGTYAAGGTVAGSNYGSGSSTAEDVVLRGSVTLTITKSDGTTTVTAGTTTTYTVTVSNLTGGFNASGATLTDPVAPGLACVSATCTATGGAVCPAPYNPGPASPSILQSGLVLGSFPAGSSLSFAVTCGVTATGQ